MNGDGAQLIFGELLSRHGHIQIPLIQRDYAQGRLDQEEVREDFLESLHDALRLPPLSERLPLNLDFIYGSVEGEMQARFQPLDGQQRLTTLFLLHWYLAWRDNCGDTYRTLCADGSVSRFSYQVRPSSSEFFDALVAFTPTCSPDDVSEVSSLLADQPWYFRNWRLDPTIQSCLVMLDAIHNRFRNETGLYKRLTDTEQPAITFQLLDLKNFGLSDDLYIKMNARGKPLTQFETFKARYEQILEQLFSGECRLLDGQSLSVAAFFSRRMDTRWADFFWPYRDRDSHVFDAAVMNLFRAVILITRSTHSEIFVEEISLLRNRLHRNSYAFFHQYDWLDVPFSEMLITLLESWSAGGSGLTPQLPNSRYFDEIAVFEKILSDATSLDYEEIVQFHAYAGFLQTYPEGTEPSVFNDWMRVVFNLSVNTEYNRPADLQRSLAALGELIPHMAEILTYLSKPGADISGFNQQQVTEEKLKACLLLSSREWRALIDKAETHNYFRGQIGFLLAFSGISRHPAEEGEEECATFDIPKLQAAFSDYLIKASTMFGRGGLNSLPDARWERALLALGDYLLPARRNHSFLVNLQTDQTSWKRLLRGAASGSVQGGVLCSLWDNLSGSENIEAQLDEVIRISGSIESWRTAFIETPAAIDYCSKRMIRRTEDGVIYLLRKSQMNGTHAELFTYCLFENKLKPAFKKGRLKALRPLYDETTSSDEEPGVRLWGNYQGEPLRFFLVYRPSHYFISLSSSESLPPKLLAFLKDIGFAQVDDCLEKLVSVDTIDKSIFELDDHFVSAGQSHG